MVNDGHVGADELDFQETRRAVAGMVAQQGRSWVQAKLPRYGGRLERPGRVDVSAAVEVRSDRPEPFGQGVRVDESFRRIFALVLGRYDHRIMARHDQAPNLAGSRNELSGLDQLMDGKFPPGRDRGSTRIETEDGRLGIDVT